LADATLQHGTEFMAASVVSQASSSDPTSAPWHRWSPDARHRPSGAEYSLVTLFVCHRVWRERRPSSSPQPHGGNRADRTRAKQPSGTERHSDQRLALWPWSVRIRFPRKSTAPRPASRIPRRGELPIGAERDAVDAPPSPVASEACSEVGFPTSVRFVVPRSLTRERDHRGRMPRARREPLALALALSWFLRLGPTAARVCPRNRISIRPSGLNSLVRGPCGPEAC